MLEVARGTLCSTAPSSAQAASLLSAPSVTRATRPKKAASPAHVDDNASSDAFDAAITVVTAAGAPPCAVSDPTGRTTLDNMDRNLARSLEGAVAHEAAVVATVDLRADGEDAGGGERGGAAAFTTVVSSGRDFASATIAFEIAGAVEWAVS